MFGYGFTRKNPVTVKQTAKNGQRRSTASAGCMGWRVALPACLPVYVRVPVYPCTRVRVCVCACYVCAYVPACVCVCACVRVCYVCACVATKKRRFLDENSVFGDLPEL